VWYQCWMDPNLREIKSLKTRFLLEVPLTLETFPSTRVFISFCTLLGL
jgi:hypothetical protein